MATVSAAPPTQCPVRSSNLTPARCPVANASDNPRNNMPVESQESAPGQSNDLPTMRVMSSIPRAPDSMYGHQGNSKLRFHSLSDTLNYIVSTRELGISITTAVLQCLTPEGLEHAGGTDRGHGSHPQQNKRGCLEACTAMGISLSRRVCAWIR